ncbi:MAG TPA: tetratricopeptide repeat protein [Terracidiphilus sp.]|nr:tetratricopeptide repeat protein [Terracidiphilus sp.]
MKGHSRRIPELLSRLEVLVQSRNIREGFALLDELRRDLKSGGDCGGSNLIPLALCLAQWMDLGYRDHTIFKTIMDRLPGCCSEMPFLDVMRLNLVEAYSCLSGEELDRAITLLDRTAVAGTELMPEYLVFLTHFWKGRAHRKRGDYKNAAWHIQAARASAERLQNPKLVAVTKIHESWLVFQNGDMRRALQLLDEAEGELRPIGHDLSLGNIESARGRFVRRSGRYQEALEHFERAIEIYRKDFSHHPNLARAMVNAAYVRRLMALDLRAGTNRGQARGSVNAKYLKLIRDALELLKQAGEIYANHHHHGGTGSVLVNTGFLHLESGDIEKASIEADRAFTLGEEKKDLILMTRARTLQSAVNRTKSEEQLDGDEDAFVYAKLGVELADEAIEIAKKTDNRRLLAEAFIARGCAALDEQNCDVPMARQCASDAATLLGEGDRDHLFRELGELKEKILRSVGVEDTLRRWSEGQIGYKTFQQVQEEFAEMVIPRVWENLGRNVSRVSSQLSISPKKVRRLLRKARMKTTKEASPEQN